MSCSVSHLLLKLLQQPEPRGAAPSLPAAQSWNSKPESALHLFLSPFLSELRFARPRINLPFGQQGDRSGRAEGLSRQDPCPHHSGQGLINSQALSSPGLLQMLWLWAACVRSLPCSHPCVMPGGSVIMYGLENF